MREIGRILELAKQQFFTLLKRRNSLVSSAAPNVYDHRILFWVRTKTLLNIWPSLKHVRYRYSHLK